MLIEFRSGTITSELTLNISVRTCIGRFDLFAKHWIWFICLSLIQMGELTPRSIQRLGVRYTWCLDHDNGQIFWILSILQSDTREVSIMLDVTESMSRYWKYIRLVWKNIVRFLKLEKGIWLSKWTAENHSDDSGIFLDCKAVWAFGGALMNYLPRANAAYRLRLFVWYCKYSRTIEPSKSS